MKFAFFLLLPLILAETEMPIIGILAMESYSVDKYFPGENFDSYIAAPYVQLVEVAGARAVPVWIGQNRDYYKKIVQNTNGLLLPGGATWFNETNGYADAGKILYDIAVEANENGDYYPIFGICLGMELLVHITNNQEELRSNCLAKKLAVPLEFKNDFKSSKLFFNLTDELATIISTKNVTYNYHQFCVTPETLSSLGLTKYWKIISTNRDVLGLEFISSMEHKKYPFFGLQFHPEKVLFVHKRIKLNIPHSLEAIKIAQYFPNFFAAEARRNDNNYTIWKEEQEALIYNYNTRFVRISEGSSEQFYMFES